MSEKHTPGPWRASWGKYLPILATVNGIEAQIGRAESFGHISDEECEANGSLIAAAPDLLAALKLLVRDVYDSGDLDRHIAQGRAAIAKAEGKP